MRFQISLRTRERAIIAQASSLQPRLQVTIKRNNRTNNAQTSHFGWAKAIFRSPERKSESMTNAAPHFPSPFSASGSECKKESRHHPSSSMRRSYVRKDILHPAGVKRSENGLPPSLPSSSVHLECQPDYDEVSSRHQECSAIAWDAKTALIFNSSVTRRVEWFLHPIRQQIA